MNVFEKIIEKLEEDKEWYETRSIDKDFYRGIIGAFSRSISVIQEVAEENGTGNISDGYHTFNELYHHRAVLFATICNSNKELAWKSKLHDTGDMYEGMFIVGIETTEGQATYHYSIEPYWEMFNVKELPKAPKWDGHTPEEAIRRISLLKEHNNGWKTVVNEEIKNPFANISTVGCVNCEHKDEYIIELEEDNNGWIPCSERLPEEDGNYIVTFDDGYISSAPFYDGNWELWCDSGEPIAWQSLPDPYKPEGE